MAIVFNNLSAGGGSELYLHEMRMNTSYGTVYFSLILNTGDVITQVSEVVSILISSGYSINTPLKVSGINVKSQEIYVYKGIYPSNNRLNLLYTNMQISSVTVGEISGYILTKNSGSSTSIDGAITDLVIKL